MDLLEDVEANPKTNKVYVMLTNNVRRKADQVDAANPRAENRFGHILEITPPTAITPRRISDGKFRALRLSLIAAVGATFNPATTKDGWFGMPDNCAIDSDGRLWIATDGNSRGATGRNDGLWAMETEGALRGTSKLFFMTPNGAELCGPCPTPDGETFFVAIQHPGEADDDDPKAAPATFENPSTRWPDFKPDMPPRPSIVAITRKGGRQDRLSAIRTSLRRRPAPASFFLLRIERGQPVGGEALDLIDRTLMRGDEIGGVVGPFHLFAAFMIAALDLRDRLVDRVDVLRRRSAGMRRRLDRHGVGRRVGRAATFHGVVGAEFERLQQELAVTPAPARFGDQHQRRQRNAAARLLPRLARQAFEPTIERGAARIEAGGEQARGVGRLPLRGARVIAIGRRRGRRGGAVALAATEESHHEGSTPDFPPITRCNGQKTVNEAPRFPAKSHSGGARRADVVEQRRNFMLRARLGEQPALHVGAALGAQPIELFGRLSLDAFGGHSRMCNLPSAEPDDRPHDRHRVVLLGQIADEMVDLDAVEAGGLPR